MKLIRVRDMATPPVYGVKLTPNTIIAGGALSRAYRGEETVADIDVFLIGCDDIEATIMAFELANNLTSSTGSCIGSDSFVIKYADSNIQLIISHTYASVADCLDAFDFKHCQFAMTNSGAVWATEEAIKACDEMQLVLHKNTEYRSVARLLERMTKFTKQGFSISPLQLAHIADKIAIMYKEKTTCAF